jgi:hypothetical protein
MYIRVALVIVAASTIILAADGSSIPPGAQIGFQVRINMQY